VETATARTRAVAAKITDGALLGLLKKRTAAVTRCYVMCALRAITSTYAGNIKRACGQYQATPEKYCANPSECHIQG
jgi:hypothetical protein